LTAHHFQSSPVDPVLNLLASLSQVSESLIEFSRNNFMWRIC